MIKINGFVAHYNGKEGLTHTKETAEFFDGKFRNKAKDPEDPVYVKCDDCGEFMEYQAGSEEEYGTYCCSGCNASVREKDIYMLMSEENEELYRRLDLK